MKVLYRISDNGYIKNKFPNATKYNCLYNFLNVWGEVNVDEITVYVDKVTPETQAMLDEAARIRGIKLVPIQGGSSAGSWRIVRDVALTYDDKEIVYFVEDDYFHLNHSRQALVEALERADYATLYDCPDKYVPARFGGNPLIGDDGADITKVLLTPTRHWRMTNSTTMTFAVKVGTLREDNEIWKKYTEGDHPHDFNCFLELREKGRALLSPIPTLSTHCEPNWAAPGVDWSKL